MDSNSGSFADRNDNTIHVHPVDGFAGVTIVTLEARDSDGALSDPVSFTLGVYHDEVQIRLEAVDAAGNVVDRIREDRDFAIRMYTQDLREDGRGVFAAYADCLLYTSDAADE